MLRFIYVVIMRTFSIMYFVPKMAYYAKHPEQYSEKDRYHLAQDVMDRVRRTARVTTSYEGQENIPEKSGYMMFANHQGKYDALGILLGHSKSCSVLMDKKRSQMFIAKQFVDLLGGQRIERNHPRQQIRVLNDMAQEVKEGRNYLIFPEGGYGKKRDNRLDEFKYGCFTAAVKAECPIVPVLILDSYKPFGMNSLKKVKTKVVFLPAIPYEEYAGMKAREVCAYVKEKIQAELDRQTEKSA
ncbi:MAG: 1-acyl-sn-glycerol-3-phosphate acyltransferase [Clostridia bacterium]|nr:1-acyl-sn-glycerol-3-phosphate acyltransferase [Clostridia bacterium]